MPISKGSNPWKLGWNKIIPEIQWELTWFSTPFNTKNPGYLVQTSSFASEEPSYSIGHSISALLQRPALFNLDIKISILIQKNKRG